MSKTKISEYSATANSNTDVASINIDEGCAPSGINNAIRAVMGHLKDFQAGTNSDSFNGPVGTTTAAAVAATTLTTSSTVTHNGGTANGVAYLNGSKVLTTGSALVFDGSNLGLGVTPSAWASPFATGVFEFSGGFLAPSAANQTFRLGQNHYYNGSSYIYKANGPASAYIQNSGSHQWLNAASGTAGNAISFTQAMTLDASGKLGIGTTSPQNYLHVQNGAGSTNGTLRLGDATYYGTIEQDASVTGAMIYTIASASGGGHIWKRGSTEFGRFDVSGNLLVGTTSTSVAAGGLTSQFAAGESYFNIGHKTGTGSGAYFGAFSYNGSIIGGVTQNGTTGVLYNLTSDYRLKNNPEALTGAKDFVMALQPKKWQWWDGSGEGVGFIAHEFMEVAKYSGNGAKDAVDAEGKPVYQSIQPSSSEVMANLVAHIQDLENRLAALEA